MDNRKDGQPDSQPPSPGAEGTDKPTTESAGHETPAVTAKIDSPALVPSQSDPTAEPATVATSAVTPKVEAPLVAPVADIRPSPDRAPQTEAAASVASILVRMVRSVPLAASIALAAVCGAIVGSIATAGLAGPRAGTPPTAAASIDDVRALKESIVRVNTEMVALKAAIDTSGRTANAQFNKFGERLDRFERAQAEPAAKLAKITDAIDRIERRPPVTAATETTSSVANLAPPAAEPARPAGPPVVEGWVVRSVYNGAALIQGRYGVIAVEPGDHLPGLGRVENIRRQDGRWVVVTSKGLIVTR